MNIIKYLYSQTSIPSNHCLFSPDDELKKKLTLGRREIFNGEHEEEKLVFYSIRHLLEFRPSTSYDDR